MATENQKAVFNKVMDKVVKGSKVSISKEMRGIYADSTSKRTNKLTKTKGWEELMNKYLPDKLLAEKHKELLTIPKKVRRFIKGDLESEYEELDSQAISKGLDMGYKLKGRYQPDKVEHSGQIEETHKFDEETEKRIAETYKKWLKEQEKKQ